jgi:hypothetical protein
MWVPKTNYLCPHFPSITGATNSEEYVPITTPMASVKANQRKVSPPKNRIAKSTIRVVNDVLKDLVNVCLRL